MYVYSLCVHEMIIILLYQNINVVQCDKGIVKYVRKSRSTVMLSQQKVNSVNDKNSMLCAVCV